MSTDRLTNLRKLLAKEKNKDSLYAQDLRESIAQLETEDEYKILNPLKPVARSKGI